MRILHIDPTPILGIPYLNAAGRGVVERVELPVLAGRVDALPGDLEALVVASDLQGLEDPGRASARFGRTGHEPRLLGCAVADALFGAAEAGIVPDPMKTGALLAGDLYTVPDLRRRGGTGDVREVWRAFAGAFRWVAGVAGNHDAFAGGRVPRGPEARAATDRFRRSGPGDLLDGDAVVRDGLRLAGVSGIIGDPKRLHRRRPDAFAAAIVAALSPAPDVLVLHEGPEVGERGRRGSPFVRDVLADLAPPGLLVVCGHCHWPEPLAELGRGVQVCNVDARCVVLTPA